MYISRPSHIHRFVTRVTVAIVHVFSTYMNYISSYKDTPEAFVPSTEVRVSAFFTVSETAVSIPIVYFLAKKKKS